MGHFHKFVESRAPVAPTADELAAFAASLQPSDPLYWPALAAADGCPDSLRELNQMLAETDCLPFAVAHQQVTVGMGA